MNGKDMEPINFNIDDNYHVAIEELTNGQKIRLSEDLETLPEEECKGIAGGFVACNAAFVAAAFKVFAC